MCNVISVQGAGDDLGEHGALSAPPCDCQCLRWRFGRFRSGPGCCTRVRRGVGYLLALLIVSFYGVESHEANRGGFSTISCCLPLH